MIIAWMHQGHPYQPVGSILGVLPKMIEKEEKISESFLAMQF